MLPGVQDEEGRNPHTSTQTSAVAETEEGRAHDKGRRCAAASDSAEKVRVSSTAASRVTPTPATLLGNRAPATRAMATMTRLWMSVWIAWYAMVAITMAPRLAGEVSIRSITPRSMSSR